MNVRSIEIDGEGRATVRCDLTTYQVEPDGEWQRGVKPNAETRANVRTLLEVLTHAVAARSRKKKEAAS